MASELTNTNPVHRFVLGKTRGSTEFCGLEVAVLAATLVCLWLGINALVATGGAALMAVGLSFLRWADNGRREHLEVRLRGTTDKRRYRLADVDDTWRPLVTTASKRSSTGR